MKKQQTFKRVVLNDNLEQVVVDAPYFREISIEGYPAHVHRDGNHPEGYVQRKGNGNWWMVTMAGLRIGDPRKTSKLAEESARAQVAIMRQHLDEAYAKGMKRIEELTP